MAKKKDDSQVKTWQKRIERAIRLRDKEKKDQGWDRFIDEYQGKFNLGKVAENMAVPPINIVYGYVQTMIPKLYLRDPYITVNAKTGAYINRAHLLEKVINYTFWELGLKKEVSRILMDALLVGHGWIKYGYMGTFSGQAQEEQPQEDTKKKKRGGKAKHEEPDPKLEINEFIKDEEIFAVYVPWDDIVFDAAMAKDPPYDCRWIAHRIIKPLKSVKESSLYENTATLKPNVGVKEGKLQKEDAPTKEHDEDFELVELWEIHDKDSNQILVISLNHDEFLRIQDNPYELEGLPFSMLKFNLVPGKPYPLSDIYMIEPQILERIKLRATQINHIKRWNRQLYIEKGSISKEELQKFELGIDGSIIQGEKGAAPPTPVQYAPMQAEIFALDDLIQRDMDATIGQTDFERGGPARSKTRTLGELRSQEMITSTRSAKRIDVLEDFLGEVAHKIIQLIKQFQVMPKYVCISGMTPQEVFQAFGEGVKFDGQGVLFSRDDIQGDFDVDVKAGSTVPMTRENKIKMLESIVPMLQAAQQSPVARAIIKEIVRELDIPEAQKAFEDEDAAMRARAQAMSAVGMQPGAGPIQSQGMPQRPMQPQIPPQRP